MFELAHIMSLVFGATLTFIFGIYYCKKDSRSPVVEEYLAASIDETTKYGDQTLCFDIFFEKKVIWMLVLTFSKYLFCVY